jgi:Sulfotransferase family
MGWLDKIDAFHEQAVQATGLHDFGAADYRHGMRLLLSDFDRDPRFNALGSELISAEIVGRLIARLLTAQGLKDHPAARQGRIERPLIVIGMPRTGTTALQRLLSQDPALQSLPMWLACTPQPRPPRESWESNPWYRAAVQALARMFEFDPGMRRIHPIWAHEPDECRFAVNHSFWAPDWSTTTMAPNYADWVLNCDAGYAYCYYRDVLNLIAAGDSRRWLLKDVCHLFNLNSFLAAFPDACIVHTHRDPLTSITSVSSLVFRLRRLREGNPDPIEHGKLGLATWAKAFDRAETLRRSVDQRRFFDIHKDEVHADPIGSVERIYRHFDIPVTDAARAAWQRHVETDIAAGHGDHHYAAEDFGLTRESVYSACGAYYERYRGVAERARAG